MVCWFGPVYQGRCSYQAAMPSNRSRKMTTRRFCTVNDTSVSVARLGLWSLSVFAYLCLIPVFCSVSSLSPALHISFFDLVTPPVSLLLGLLNRIISVRHFLFAQPFVLFEFISQSDSPSSIFPSLCLSLFFYHFPTSFLPGLCHSPPPPPSLPPPFFSLSGVLLSKVIALSLKIISRAFWSLR